MKRILVCPVCKSTEIVLDAGGYTGKYKCKNCGYVGSLIIEMSEGEYEELMKAKELDKKIEDREAKRREEGGEARMDKRERY